MSEGGERAKLYDERAAQFAAEAERLAARSRLLSNLRGVSFAVMVIAALVEAFSDAERMGAAVALAGAAAFAFFVFRHGRVIRLEDEALRWERVNRNAKARVTDAWLELPDDGTAFAKEPASAYADDLDLFGRGSLFQRVCTARTGFGQRALARLLTSTSSLEQVAERQEAARGLAPELETRQRLEALAMAVVGPAQSEASRAGYATRPTAHVVPDAEPLLAWAEGEPVLIGRPLLVWTARLLPPVTIAALVTAWVIDVPAWVWGAPLALQVILGYRTRAETTHVFNAVSATEGAFLRYGPMLELFEKLDVGSALLQRLQTEALSGEQRPSEAMRDFEKGVGWFELRHNGLVHPFVNALTLWDIHCVLLLERWQRRSGKVVRRWFEALAELEALCSMAALAHDEPDFAFAEVEPGAKFVAEGLGHPLIAPGQRVTNEVDLAEPGTALLVTGSNMSGKSTLLRAIGLAAVLAYAGGPVCAHRLRLGRMRVGTSIRIRDSLERGVSHFYAELAKLKAVLDATNGEEPVLFLLDEILHGTNSLERQVGARWVLSELLRRGAMGAVSTHDMELCRLTGELAERVRQVHFREGVQGGEMTFDYKMRSGPVTAGNALRLMRIVGLEVPLEEATGPGVAPDGEGRNRDP